MYSGIVYVYIYRERERDICQCIYIYTLHVYHIYMHIAFEPLIAGSNTHKQWLKAIKEREVSKMGI